jgi:chemotaxis response regulator CheB
MESGMISCYLLIADDNSAFVNSVRRCLMLESSVIIVGHARTANDAIKQITMSNPNVVFLSDDRVAAAAVGADGFLAKINISADAVLAFCAIRPMN